MKKTAFITGAGGYIGSEVALELSKEGFVTAICDINDVAVENTVKKIREIGGECKGYIADVSDYESLENAMKSFVRDFGRLDVMVHVAGGSARIASKNVQYLTLDKQDISVIDRVLKVNLYGAIYASKAAAKIMIEQGEGGKIINFSSVIAFNGLSTCSEYAAAKGGVVSLTKSLAKEWGPYKINVNAVAPGVVVRPDEADGGRATQTNFLGKKCTAKDVAFLTAFLASDKAGFITGQTYVCDGGRGLAMKGSD